MTRTISADKALRILGQRKESFVRARRDSVTLFREGTGRGRGRGRGKHVRVLTSRM